MKVLIVVLVFGISAVYGACPKKQNLGCWMYDRGLENCTNVKTAFIEYKGKRCDACQICVPESGKYGCPSIKCPYKRLEETYPMDCGIFPHAMKVQIGERICDACSTFIMDCSDTSWAG